jgi:hypothetical protein
LIDTSRPMEMTDGTPVVPSAARRSRGPGFVVDLADGSRRGLCYNPDGTSPYGNLPLRNVAPALDLTQPLETRGGCDVRYIATDGSSLIVEITRYGTKGLERRNLDGSDYGRAHRRLGMLDTEDVINKVVRTEAFFNVYSDGSTGHSVHLSRKDAAERSKVGKSRIGILKVVTVNGVVTASAYEALEPHTRTSGTVRSVANPQTAAA